MAAVAEHAGHAVAMALHGFVTLPFWLAAGGVFTAWLFDLKAPQIPAAIDARLGPLRTLLENKYYFDWFNERVLAVGARMLGTGLWKGGDQAFIDGTLVNGSARGIGALAGVVRRLQTGQLYWYALVMVVGIFGFLTWRLWPMLTR
jgi:NADH-quinone oxidoreductase subunit L